MRGGDLQSIFLNKAMSFAKGKICSGDPETIKQNAIRALQLMPASAVIKLIQQTPLCSSQGSMSVGSIFGGKRGKTRKQKRKQRKTRKH